MQTSTGADVSGQRGATGPLVHRDEVLPFRYAHGHARSLRERRQLGAQEVHEVLPLHYPRAHSGSYRCRHQPVRRLRSHRRYLAVGAAEASRRRSSASSTLGSREGRAFLHQLVAMTTRGVLKVDLDPGGRRGAQEVHEVPLHHAHDHSGSYRCRHHPASTFVDKLSLASRLWRRRPLDEDLP